MERCWQRYGGKLVGPEEKTGRKEENKAHFVLFPFSRCALSCVLAFALSLLRVVLWLWTLIEDNRQLVERWEVADLLADNNLLLEAVDCNDLLKSEWHRGEQERLRRIKLCWTERPVLAEQFTNRILVGIWLFQASYLWKVLGLIFKKYNSETVLEIDLSRHLVLFVGLALLLLVVFELCFVCIL